MGFEITLMTSTTVQSSECKAVPKGSVKSRFSRVCRSEDPRNVADWDARVDSLPGGGFFHTQSWASVLAETYGYTPAYHATWQGDSITGMFPLMILRSWLTGTRAICLPFTDFCRPLAMDSDTGEMLLEELTRRAKSEDCRYLEIRGSTQGLSELNPSSKYLEHRIDLSDEVEAMKRLRSEVRTAIRKAEKIGVMVAQDDRLSAMEEFFRLQCLSRRRHGLPPQPWKFFETIWRHIIRSGKGRVFLASHSGRVVAGAVFFHFGDEVIYKFGASDMEFQKLRANNLLFWTAIQAYSKAGSKVMSMGRSSIEDQGLRQFKCGWGANESEVPYFRLRSGQLTPMAVTGKEEGWHNQVFSRLPLPVSRIIGRLLYKHIG